MSIQKRDFLDKVKEREDCNPAIGGKYIGVFRGLQSECDAEIVQKGRFRMGTRKIT